MCDPVTIGLILSAAGAGTQYVNNQVALKRQDREAARGIRKQGEIQKESNQRVGEQIDDIAGSTGDAERAEALAGFQDSLRAADSTTQGSLPADALMLGANPRFAEAVSQGRSQISRDANDRAGRMSIIDAAVTQRMNEGARVGRTVTDLNEKGAQSRAEAFINKLRIAERAPNEFVNMLGQIMSGAGSAIAMGGSVPAWMGGAKTVGAANAGKLYKAGSLIDNVNTVNPYVAAASRVA